MSDHDPLDANETSPISYLATWANEQDAWIRLVVKNILERRSPLDASAIDECFSHLLVEKRLSNDALDHVEMISTQPSPTSNAPALTLDAITRTRDINRLIPNQELAFNPHLTVVYGENASGKTGYVRVLKQVAGARSAEPVLSDIYQDHAVQPSATVRFTLGDEQHEFHWTEPTDPHPELERIIVFDPPATPLHLDNDLTYLYTPSEIKLFEYVYDALTETRSHLSRELSNRHPGVNPFLARFQHETPCYQLVESLGASTSHEELRDLAIVDNAEHLEALTSLRNELLQLQLGNGDGGITLERAIHRWTTLAIDTIRALQEFDGQCYKAALDDISASEQRLRHVSDNLFADDDLLGLFSDEWKAFVSATDIYARLHIHEDFPDGSDTCPYCRQQLTYPARSLLAKYRSYLLDESQLTLRNARTQLQSLEESVLKLPSFDDILDIDIPDSPPSINGHEEPDWRRCVVNIRDLVIQQQQQVRSRTAWKMGIEDSVLERYCSVLRARHTIATEQIENATAADAERASRIETTKRQVSSIEDQLVLGELLQPITEYVQALKWDNRANSVVARFQGILRSLTNAEKNATEVVLNSTFKEAFETECKLLDCPDVELTFPGRRGTTTRHKSISRDHQMRQVLSEGEQKVVALADFLAEVSLRPRSAPIVFDDPVSSLDARRRDDVAARLVSLSEVYQVIIFTHEPYFASKLIAAFEASERRQYLSSHQIFAEDGKIGLVEQGSHPRMDTVAKIGGRINRVLQDARASTGAKRAGNIASAYGHLRTWIEMFVEDELLNGSIKRHRANISVDRLRDVDGAAVNRATETLIHIYDRSSRRMWPHSQPFEALQSRPTLQELEDDWTVLQNLRNSL